MCVGWELMLIGRGGDEGGREGGIEGQRDRGTEETRKRD